MTSKGVWVDTNDGNWVSTDVSTTPARLASRLNDPGELFQTSLRAQNSASEQYEADPPYGGDIIAPLHHGLSNMFGGMTQQPLLPDPFAGGSSGRLNGPQPYRFGTTTRADIAILPSENTNGAGDFGIMELNAELEYKRPLPPCWLIPWSQSWVWSIAPQFGYRSYDGPGTDTIGLSPDAYRFGLGMQLATPLRGPWSVQLDFDPSINTDFDQALSSNAYQFDGSGILYYRVSEQLMYAFGAGFLDRVDDQVIPYAGFVFTPNEYWEFRILYPESYISLFMGNIYGVSQWLYTRAEYHIEAYEVGISNTGVRDQIQIEDYRILLGIRSEGYGVSSFLEAGVVFGRDVKFRGPTRDFDPSSGFIARFGMRF
ncbi:MAG: hypothetical protein CMJ78_24145 [Planctomycetaceae bacterium]|nr:hypothetical protein [Planctomycetaceae bacterium]